jgi:glucose-1-phosphate cytidylyltransferase
MKVVILAGGFGTRLSEETTVRPKPMVEIGGKPILWHIMKLYAAHGLTDFIVCCGYKGHVIREWFANYGLRESDIAFDLTTGESVVHRRTSEPWTVTLVETGEDTQTGGRLRRVADYLDYDEPFCMTYGDAVSNVDISALIDYHARWRTLATITAVRPPPRFGALVSDGRKVLQFQEKPDDGTTWINGGFFVLSPLVLSYILDDSTVWELAPLERLTADGELSAYHHEGFWHPMDTMSDLHTLEEWWKAGTAPWKVW